MAITVRRTTSPSLARGPRGRTAGTAISITEERQTTDQTDAPEDVVVDRVRVKEPCAQQLLAQLRSHRPFDLEPLLVEIFQDDGIETIEQPCTGFPAAASGRQSVAGPSFRLTRYWPATNTKPLTAAKAMRAIRTGEDSNMLKT